jgi:hypothetical protein
MSAILRQDLWQKEKGTLSGYAIEEIKISAEQKQRAEPTYILNEFSSDHRGGDQDVSIGPKKIAVLRLLRLPFANDLPMLINDAILRVTHTNALVIHYINLSLESIGQHSIVIVEKRDKTCTSMSDPNIS